MKKVLAIAPYPFLPAWSGGQKFIANFFHWLGKEVDLSVISVPGNDLSLDPSYKIIPLLKPGFSRYYDASLVNKISSIVNKGNFDTVIWEHPYYAWLASRIKRKTGVNYFYHTHNIEYQRFRSTGRWWWPILKTYEKWAFKKADGIFFITPEDRKFAINTWKISSKKCIDLPFGIDIKKYPEDRSASRRDISAKHNIGPTEKILFFNGLLSYKPNLDALKVILDKVNPLLLSNSSFIYKIIICGKGLPAEMNSLTGYREKNIIFAGFTDQIDLYYKASDLLLNPVLAGGGIKTKMVEAIGYGTTVISTQTGAAGMDKAICGDKLVTVPDNHWKGFADAIVTNANSNNITPASFYEHYYWGNIIASICRII